MIGLIAERPSVGTRYTGFTGKALSGLSAAFGVAITVNSPISTTEVGEVTLLWIWSATRK